MPLTIAVDFDGTWTADPGMWLAFVQSALSCGHNVFICTMRGECEENVDEIRRAGVPDGIEIVFCSNVPKRHVCREEGIDVDIWIDDAPFFICSHSPGVTFVEKEEEKAKVDPSRALELAEKVRIWPDSDYGWLVQVKTTKVFKLLWFRCEVTYWKTVARHVYLSLAKETYEMVLTHFDEECDG